MAATVTHKFVSAKADGTDASVVKPSDWNDEHDITAAGSDTQVQFNDGGSFGADAGLTWNKTDRALYLKDDNFPQLTLHSITSNGSGAIQLFASNGSSAERTYSQNTDILGELNWGGYTRRGEFSSGTAEIVGYADGDATNDAVPGRLDFKTEGAIGLAPTRLSINSVGNVTVFGKAASYDPGSGPALHILDQGTEATDYALKVEGGQNDLGPQATRLCIPNGTKSSASDAGRQWELAADANFLYICTAGGTAGNATWKKVALSAAA